MACRCESFVLRPRITGATISHEDPPNKPESKSAQVLFWRLTQHKWCTAAREKGRIVA
jgi:hypothetical protein